MRSVARALVSVVILSILSILSPVAARAQAVPAKPPLSSDAALAKRVEAIITRPEFRHAMWGIAIYSLDEKRTLYALNADKLFVPASTTKLLTEGTALAVLGLDYRFHTKVYAAGTLSADGTLDGDLVLVASGDPNLSGRIRPDGTLAFENEDHAYGGADPAVHAVPGDPLLVIAELANRTAARVKAVNGRVLVDISLFAEGQAEGGSGVIMSPIMVNDNVIDVVITPGTAAGAPTALAASPATAYATFVNRSTTGAAGSDNTIRWAADSVAPDGNHIVTVGGSLPAGGPPILFPYDVPLPSRFAAVTFTEALRKAGVRMNAPAAVSPPDWKQLATFYTDARVVAEHLSPPLSEEAKVTLKVSDNLHAAVTPMIIGAVVGHGDTLRNGFDIEREFLTRAGLDLSGAHQSDGLGADDHFSPAFMVSYLAYYATRPEYPKFLAALPVLGRDGTLWNIQTANPAAGHVFAKTGTFTVSDPLNRNILVTAKGLAGYVTTAAGRRLVFAIYVNNVAVAKNDDVTRIAGQAVGAIAAAAYAP